MTKEYPPVSVYCSTYGRAHCLEELIYSFLQQDYKGTKELVILNDYKEQELVFNHPEVSIINSTERINPLGKKFNQNIACCAHDILCCMEDDDIYLPHHLTYAVDNMRNGIFHSGIAYCKSNPVKLHKSGNHFHATHVFTRDLFNRVGGYPDALDNCTVDVSIMNKFRQVVGNYTQSPKPEDWSYIYVWGNGSYHGSGWGAAVHNMGQLAAMSVEQLRKAGQIPTGTVILEPKWRHDYIEMARKCREELNANS